MTGSTSVVSAAGARVLLPPRLLPIALVVLGLVLLAGPAAAASSADAQSGAPVPETTGDSARQSDGSREAPSAPYALDGRSRFEVRFGISDVKVDHDVRTDAVDVLGGSFSLSFVHWARENLALEVSLRASNIDVRTRRTVADETVHVDGLYGIMVGGRAYLPVQGAFRPHVNLARGLRQAVHRGFQPGVGVRRERVGGSPSRRLATAGLETWPGPLDNPGVVMRVRAPWLPAPLDEVT